MHDRRVTALPLPLTTESNMMQRGEWNLPQKQRGGHDKRPGQCAHRDRVGVGADASRVGVHGLAAGVDLLRVHAVLRVQVLDLRKETLFLKRIRFKIVQMSLFFSDLLNFSKFFPAHRPTSRSQLREHTALSIPRALTCSQVDDSCDRCNCRTSLLLASACQDPS